MKNERVVFVPVKAGALIKNPDDAIEGISRLKELAGIQVKEENWGDTWTAMDAKGYDSLEMSKVVDSAIKSGMIDDGGDVYEKNANAQVAKYLESKCCVLEMDNIA